MILLLNWRWNLHRTDCRQATQIGHGHAIPNQKWIRSKENLHEIVGRMDLIDCFRWIFMSTFDENCFRTGPCFGEENARIKVKSLIDSCPNIQILWVETVVFGVFFN